MNNYFIKNFILRSPLYTYLLESQQSSKSVYKISKRYYPGGEKVMGHAMKLLNASKKIPPFPPEDTSSTTPSTPQQNMGEKQPMTRPTTSEASQLPNANNEIRKTTQQANEKLTEVKNHQDPLQYKNSPPALIDSSEKFEEISTKMPVNRLDSYTQKVLQLIPSTRAYKENYVKALDAKELASIQRKEALYYFVQYFEKLPEQFIRNPLFLMMYYKKLTENLPEIQVRSFQLAMEMYLRKNLLNLQDMANIFENKFSIEDIVNKNAGVGDIGTFFSALQANYLYTQPGFKEKVDTCLVIATCINSSDLSKLPEHLRNRIEEIRKATGNTVNDIDLNGHYYDFKITKDPCYARNHIMFISLDNDKQNFTNISNNMVREFKNKLNILYALQKKGNTVEQQYQLEYYIKLQEKINEIKNSTSTDVAKLNEWNSFLFTDLYKRPHTIYVPLFIPISRNFQPNTELASEITKIPLSFKQALQPLDVAEALKNVLAQWNPETKDKAFRETQGVLGEPLMQKEEVD